MQRPTGRRFDRSLHLMERVCSKHWLEGGENEDATRMPVGDDRLPALFGATRDFADNLRDLREDNREILDHDLIAALDDFLEAADVHVSLATQNVRQLPHVNRYPALRHTLSAIIEAAQPLIEVAGRSTRLAAWSSTAEVLGQGAAPISADMASPEQS
jgi:hypothetical protein